MTQLLLPVEMMGPKKEKEKDKLPKLLKTLMDQETEEEWDGRVWHPPMPESEIEEPEVEETENTS